MADEHEDIDEILKELSNNKDCHGEGPLYASLLKNISFKHAYDYAIGIQNNDAVHYGPYVYRGTNCSRFVRTVALIGISTLPRPNFWACDEGFSSLDADNSANLPMVFDYLKSQFDFIFLISHMDYIRDFVDISLDLKKENDFSKIVFK